MLKVIGFGTSSDRVLQDFHPSVRSQVSVDDSKSLIDEQDMIEEYHKHDILVFPSLYEGFGMVFLEAMASGLAVIATPTGGVVDVIRHGENGYVVGIGDPESLASAITHLWTSPKERRRLGAAAREAASVLTWDRSAALQLTGYRQLAQRNRLRLAD